ncbi:SAM-dependent methyltransferase [Streptomyces rimosus subsp. rimosus ATCC 10970]|uniref:SAM-dependent methyltransferase n=2 Tax=Streptomyces rimosus subsp. rimosus TaxID=132474 RepID=A0A8A1UF82_STRR1|nr:hypothetical protein ADK46_30620 [Streptomyces rimosus subsp. rimosus]MYT42285.1 SAM-dependent methyltransferase [Streptomyces sp. SID5471]QST78798.1 SAM-dependent methyltransferase [Streptomyces rimosus subsp. rimosus ATCC 10970]UNZ08565.1 N5-glutamine S-adenosyl-L-methionine-dependent methyltransferase [Streptomyces rimosus subsp. rimosus]
MTAAVNGCDRVTATDLSPQAAANTALNAHRHGVRDIVSTGCGDMYEPVGTDRYDLIFWNSGARYTELAWPETEGLGRTIADPGYTAHATYLAQARQHLTHNGRLMLGFADSGDRARLNAIARQHRWHILHLETMTFADCQRTSSLLEFLPCPRTPDTDACPACP